MKTGANPVEMIKRGVVFDIKKYALHDGPGIRTTVFLKGCPLRCAWCHNPEGQLPHPEVMVKSSLCLTECNACIEGCPQAALSRRSGSLHVERESCRACGTCAGTCPTGALEMAGRLLTPEQVVSEIFRDSLFYEESGGGVTFSGGEPLLQPEFLLGLLETCRRRGLHAVVDTSGYAPWEVLRRVAGTADLFFFDLKFMEDEKHKRWTGVSNRIILENLRRLDETGRPLVIRIPLVGGVNDGLENARMTAEFVKPLRHVKWIDLLSYHALGNAKHVRLGRGRGRTPGREAAPGRRFSPPNRMKLEAFRRIFQDAGLKVKLGG